MRHGSRLPPGPTDVPLASRIGTAACAASGTTAKGLLGTGSRTRVGGATPGSLALPCSPTQPVPSHDASRPRSGAQRPGRVLSLSMWPDTLMQDTYGANPHTAGASPRPAAAFRADVRPTFLSRAAANTVLVPKSRNLSAKNKTVAAHTKHDTERMPRNSI